MYDPVASEINLYTAYIDIGYTVEAHHDTDVLFQMDMFQILQGLSGA